MAGHLPAEYSPAVYVSAGEDENTWHIDKDGTSWTLCGLKVASPRVEMDNPYEADGDACEDCMAVARELIDRIESGEWEF